MSAPQGLFVAGLAVYATYKFLSFAWGTVFGSSAGREAIRYSAGEEDIRYGNPNYNHDDDKRMYATREAAKTVVRRMQAQGAHDSERLVEYYNRERGGWFVGNRHQMY